MAVMKAEYVDHMGDDLSVVNAARVSFDKVSEWVHGHDGDYKYLSDADTRLIKYLARHNHWTPFAHTSICLRMSAPVPIRTQCFKSKQGFVENEESRRYISSRPEVFIPDVFRSAPEGSVKQGSGGAHPNSDKWLEVYSYETGRMVGIYEAMIQDGVCPEQARFILPQGCIVNWIWTGNLASYTRFYKERTYEKAQKETQDLAHMVAHIIKPLYPVSWAALTEEHT
jgi:thymidylate synthase (FAD)